jgi:hypothetical protein
LYSQQYPSGAKIDPARTRERQDRHGGEEKHENSHDPAALPLKSGDHLFGLTV